MKGSLTMAKKKMEKPCKKVTQKEIDKLAVAVVKVFIRKRFKKYVLWQMEHALWEEYGPGCTAPFDERVVCVATLDAVLAKINVALKQVNRSPAVRRMLDVVKQMQEVEY